MLDQLKHPLHAFKSTMERFTEKLRSPDGRFSRVSKQLTWALWNKTESKEYLGKFEQFKSLLNAWLLLDISLRASVCITFHRLILTYRDMDRRDHDKILEAMTAAAKQQEHAQNRVMISVNDAADQQRAHNRILTSISDATYEQRQQITAEQRTKIIDWLSPINFFLRQADIASARQPGTGEWLLADSRFQQWESGSGRTLWCRGIPGAGKTVLASMVVDHLNAQSENRNLGIGCVYLNHIETGKQTPSNLLSGLWRQLVFSKNITSAVERLYQRHAEKQTRPSLDETEELLRSIIPEWSKVYIVVDALDEYPEHQRLILLKRLAMMGPTVNLLLTSRPHITFNDPVMNVDAIVEIYAKQVDIQKYVDAQIQISPRLSKHVRTRPELREEIQTQIACSMDGMFLLAKLHMDSLSTKSTIKAVREALQRLPNDLEHTYEDAMQRIDSQNEEDRRIAHLTLTWVANVKRPLRVPELREALAIEPGAKQLDQDNILDIEIILSVCAGLVIVEASGPTWYFHVVRLVHYTTQNYLDSIQASRFPHAQTNIACSLLTLLNFDNDMDPSGVEKDSIPVLFDYCQYCLMHAAGKPEAPLKDILIKFLEQAHIWKNFAESSNALHVASYRGHLEMVKLLIEKENAIDEDWKPLHAASSEGHEQIIRLLLQRGVDVNAQGGEYGSALQAASYHGRDKIVQLLIECGADVNTEGGEYGSALQAASAVGNGNIVQLLVANGADVNRQGEKYSTALQVASSHGHKDIVRFLVEHGAIVDAQGGEYRSGLHEASYRGHKSIVRLLVENGATVNAIDGRYGNALHAAASKGHEKIIRLLIAKGANLTAQGGPYGNVMETAAHFGHEHIVRLIIDKLTEPNARDPHAMQTATQWLLNDQRRRRAASSRMF
ncbi:hypothetical protein C8R44DRAFT_926117 [Mycena epipterygia]|nr:hypothetical protein C8R44DRAFT_926117 [Mycena epipterygia]